VPLPTYELGMATVATFGWTRAAANRQFSPQGGHRGLPDLGGVASGRRVDKLAMSPSLMLRCWQARRMMMSNGLVVRAPLCAQTG
jgi:hypothetical protein